MTTHSVTFAARGGGEVRGDAAVPEGSGRAPAVIVLQEYWGVNDHIRSLVTRLASAGFLAVAPDLFHGKVTRDPGEASQLASSLDTLQAVAEIGGAVDWARGHERGNGRVGVVGFCLGGALAFASGCHLDDLGAVVSFYGVPPAEKVDFARATAPILAHFAAQDQWAKPERARAIQQQIEQAGRTTMRLEVYDAGHAFLNDTRPEAFSAEAASIAWTRTIDFLRASLG